MAVGNEDGGPLFRLGRSGVDPRVEYRNAGLFERAWIFGA